MSAAAEFTRAKLIPRGEYRALQACVQTALEVLEISIATVRASETLQKMAIANFPFQEALLRRIDDPVEAIARFDAFVDVDGTLRFLEYNPGLCGGAFNSYRAAKLFLDGDAGQALAQASPLEATPTPRLYVGAVWDACVETLGRGAQIVALIWPGAPPAETPREMAAFADELALRGGTFVMVGDGEVERRDGALFTGDRRIDAAFVMDWRETAVSVPTLAEPLAGTWMANSLGGTIFRGGKHLYAVMSDPAFGAPFSDAQRVWIDKHIPRTRMLPAAADTGPAAAAMREDALSRQQDLIMKPSLGRGGFGIVAGWAVDEAQWREAILSPVADSFLIQQRVFPRLEEPFDDRAPAGEKVFADLCMFVWGNKHADGLVSRASSGWLLNVSAGEAKAVPVLVQG